MLRVQERESKLSVVRVEPAGPTVWSGCIMFCLALIPLVSAPGLTLPRLATAVVLATAAAVLIQLGLPKRRVVFESLSALAERTPRGSEIALAGDLDNEPQRYRAELAFEDGSRTVILEDDEPARVLAEAELASRRLSLPLRLGWGLERQSPGLEAPVDAIDDGSAPSVRRATLAVYPSQQRVAYATLGGAVFVALATLALAFEPPRAGRTLTGLSLILPALTVVIGLVLGFLFHQLEARLELRGGALARSYYLAGMRVAAPQTLCRDVTALYAVAPDGGPARHLLVRTRDGLKSVFAGGASALGSIGVHESAQRSS